MRMRTTCVAGAVLALTLAGRAHAAGVTGVMLGSSWRSWTATDQSSPFSSLSQGSGQLAIGVGLTPNADLVIATAGAATKLESASGDRSLDGVGAVSGAVLLRLASERLLLKLTTTLPTGTRELDVDQLAVLESIGQPLLGFAVRHLGTGLEAGGSAAWRVHDGPGHRVSVGAGGVVRGAYTLANGMDDLHPAPEWAVTTGFERRGADSAPAPLRVDLTWRGFGTDRFGDEDVFREGGQLEAQLAVQGDAAPLHGIAVARAVVKARNELLAPAGSAVASIRVRSGNVSAIRLQGDRDAGADVRFGLVAEGVVVTSSEAEGRNGYVLGAGPHVRFGVGSGASVDVGARYEAGRVDGIDGAPRHGIHGVAVDLRLQWAPSAP